MATQPSPTYDTSDDWMIGQWIGRAAAATWVLSVFAGDRDFDKRAEWRVMNGDLSILREKREECTWAATRRDRHTTRELLALIDGHLEHVPSVDDQIDITEEMEYHITLGFERELADLKAMKLHWSCWEDR